MTVSVANLTSLLLQLLCLPVEPAEHRNRSRWIALDHVEPERMCFSSAGELGERPGAVRSAGNRTREVRVRRSDRGVLLYAYFLLDKQEKVRRPRFGNRKYNLLTLDKQRPKGAAHQTTYKSTYSLTAIDSNFL